MLLSILAIVLVFGLIIFVHELGHMLAAKACGVAVPDFSIGMGPSLYQFQAGGTRFHLSALPIGGYAAIAGLGGDLADAPGAPRARTDLDELDKARHVSEQAPVDPYPDSAKWQSKTGWQKTLILVAGPLMNFALALVVMLCIGLIGFPSNAVMISGVEPGSPAAEAGLKPNDLILELDGRSVSRSNEFMRIVQAHQNEPLQILVQRGREQLGLTAIPRIIEGFNENKASLGVVMGEIFYMSPVISLVPPKTVGYEQGLKVGDIVTHVNGQPINNGWEVLFSLAEVDFLNPLDTERPDSVAGEGKPIILTVQRDDETLTIVLPADTTMVTLGVQFQPRLERLPLGESLTRSLRDARDMAVLVVLNMRMLFTEQGVKSMSGPVGIMALIGQSAQSGWHSLLQILILLNVFIGVFNLLPVPALDGGRLVFVMLNGIGIRVPPQREALVHLVGMIMLLGLILVVTFTDILAFF